MGSYLKNLQTNNLADIEKQARSQALTQACAAVAPGAAASDIVASAQAFFDFLFPVQLQDEPEQ